MTRLADPKSVVAICIATYRRPDGLKALIDSINAIDLKGDTIRPILVIVDNCPDALAKDVLGDLQALTPFQVIDGVQPVPGIVSARNCCLDLVPEAADFIAFVDDDEVVTPGWLAAHLRTLEISDAVAVQGAVQPDYMQPPTGWMETLSVFETGPFDFDGPIPFAATNNSVIRADFVRRHALRFDMRFNRSGGEDQEFYDRVQALGGPIWASPDAVVHDQIPAHRMTLKWIKQRSFRTGNTLSRIALLRGRGRLLRFCKGTGLMAVGALRGVVSLPFSKAGAVRGLLQLHRGAGMLAAFVRLDYQEYSAAAVQLDRREGG